MITSDTAIPEIPVSKIAVTSFVLMPPKPIIGVSVFKASIISLYPFKPKTLNILPLVTACLKGLKLI